MWLSFCFVPWPPLMNKAAPYRDRSFQLGYDYAKEIRPSCPAQSSFNRKSAAHSRNTEQSYRSETSPQLFILISAHLSTLTSSIFFHQPRCQSGKDLFSERNVLWVAEMRLIVIREPIITLLLLLSLMLTTASLPICLSCSMTISLCLPARSLSLCQSACVSLGPSVLVLVNLLPGFVVNLAVFPVLKRVPFPVLCLITI